MLEDSFSEPTTAVVVEGGRAGQGNALPKSGCPNGTSLRTKPTSSQMARPPHNVQILFWFRDVCQLAGNARSPFAGRRSPIRFMFVFARPVQEYFAHILP